MPDITTITRAVIAQKLNIKHLEQLITLQTQVIKALTTPEWLRENTKETFADILTASNPHTATYGTFNETGETLTGAVIITEQQLPPITENHVTLKLILVHPQHRTEGLASALLTSTLLTLNETITTPVACTIHADNTPSKRLFQKHGFVQQVQNYMSAYGPRDVFIRRANI